MYIYPLGPIVAQIVGILDRDCDRHMDHNRILSQQSVSVRDERIRTDMRVPNPPKSGTPILMTISDLHDIVDSIGTVLSKRI